MVIGIQTILGNYITKLKGCPSEFNKIDISYNDLPSEIIENDTYIKWILKLQDEYSIWNSDGELNIPRFKIMMDDIINEYDI